MRHLDDKIMTDYINLNINFWVGEDGTQLLADPARDVANWHTYIGADYLKNHCNLDIDPDSDDGGVYDAMFARGFLRVTKTGKQLLADNGNQFTLSAQQKDYLLAAKLDGFDITLNKQAFVESRDNGSSPRIINDTLNKAMDGTMGS